MRVSIRRGDDWSALYIDGECRLQGHSLRLEDVLLEIGIVPDSEEVDFDWLESRGEFPRLLSDVLS